MAADRARDRYRGRRLGYRRRPRRIGGRHGWGSRRGDRLWALGAHVIRNISGRGRCQPSIALLACFSADRPQGSNRLDFGEASAWLALELVRSRRLELPRSFPTATSTLRVYQFRHDRTWPCPPDGWEWGACLANTRYHIKPHGPEICTSPGGNRVAHQQRAVPYADAVAEMEQRIAAIRAGTAPELVWLLEHPPLYTAGTSARPEDLLDPDRLPVYQHRPRRAIHLSRARPARRLCHARPERPAAAMCAAMCGGSRNGSSRPWRGFNVKGERRDGRIGVWVAGRDADGREDKIAAIGVRVRRWVSYHGIALNVDPDLDHFRGIVPCGITEHGVTSLARLGITASMPKVDLALRTTFDEVLRESGGLYTANLLPVSCGP